MSTGPSHEDWYRETRPRFDQLARTVEGLLQGLLLGRVIDYLAVTSRTKTVESFVEKLRRKSYIDPRKEVTDLCGIRVITYLESDLQRVSELIRDTFDVDESRSEDKSIALAVDRFGYRSIHFICKFGQQRLPLPEYADFSDLVFEVQVRTALQHAWAQIEHDRNYKFSGVLPDRIQRRLYLAAGLLEIADREFSAVASEIDLYASEVADKTAAGDLDIGIDSTSLLSYALEKLTLLDGYEIGVVAHPVPRAKLVEELRAFEIRTLRALDELITEELIAATKETYTPGKQTDIGLIRDAMIYSDIVKYFDDAWKRHWTVIDEEGKQILEKKYGSDMIESVLKENKIRLQSEEEEEYDEEE